MDDGGSEGESEKWLRFVVTDEAQGQRLDQFLTQRVPGVGRRLAAEICRMGETLVDGRRAKKSTLLQAQNEVLVRMGAWGKATPAPHLDLRVVFEDGHLVIVDKPAGIPSGALLHREHDTMAGALLARYPEMADVGFSPREPGLVHRLDNDTSGLLLAARTQESFLKLRESLAAGRIEKRYLALVLPGALADDTGIIDLPLRAHPSDQKRTIVARPGEGRPSRTKYRVLRRGSACDLVEASVGAAFRHQIRIHLATLGAPLLGDHLYGDSTEFLPNRHALHASYIGGTVAGIGPFEAISALPPDLNSLLAD